MSNNISFSGYLGQDSELKTVGAGTVLAFTVANTVGFKDKKTTNWFNCSLWGANAQALQNFLKKGKQVLVHGELTIREYETKEGVKRTSNDVRVTNVELIGGKQTSETVKKEVEVEIPF